MKNKIILVIAILFAAGLNSSQAQDTWVQKANFGGTARSDAVGFSIDSKGYIGTGSATDGLKNDFWEYDPATNAWSQKADFAGTARYNAVGFSIGSKGYIGTGNDGNYYYPFTNDFWEYDPTTNTWTQKANFGGTAREDAVGFSIGSKGYIGTGDDLDQSSKKDFWEYDPGTNTWTQKADFGGNERTWAVGFSIGSKGYIGTGWTPYEGYYNDFWEYDPSTNTWTQKTDFGGTARASAVGFSIGSNGYVGTGFYYDGSIHAENDFWEYDPATDAWVQRSDFGGVERRDAVGFSIDSKGYIGTGWDESNNLNDFWEYTPGTSSCAVPTNLSATNITATSAKLNWDVVAEGEGYKVRYRVKGTTAWTKKMATANAKTINGLSPNTTYNWEVQTFCQINPPHVKSEWSSKQTFTTAEFKVGKASSERSFDVEPNPFTSSTTISFSLQPHSGPYGQPSQVTIELFDVAGRKLQTLLNENTEAGNHQVTLHRDQLSEGIYFIKLSINGEVMTRKILVQ